jgi:hypothetical protein
VEWAKEQPGEKAKGSFFKDFNKKITLALS